MSNNFNATGYTQGGPFKTPNGGSGPGGSGPVENNDEIICDVLTEIISTLFKIYTRLIDHKEQLSN
jgi:hypothetical protein